MGKERSRLCLCTCTTHCRTFSVATCRYDGTGCWIPRGTRDNHARDEKRLRAERSRKLDYQPPIPPPNPPSLEGNTSPIKCFEDEFMYLSSCPTTSLTKPLLFLNDPCLHGAFVPPQFGEIIRGNTGKYALRPDRQVNEAFIFVENRLCNILALLDNIDSGEDSKNALAQAVCDHLVHLNHQKGMQWAQYRGILQGSAAPRSEAPSLVVVNPGARKFLLYMYCYFLPRKSSRTTFLPTGTIDASSEGGSSPHSRS